MSIRSKLPMRRMVVWGFAGAVLAASVAYIASTFEWHAAFGVLGHADPVWFFLGGGYAIVAYWGVRALRWRYLMREMGAPASFLDLYLCSSVALSLSVFTPLQSGEALKVELLKRYGRVARLPGYSAFALERAADLYVVASIGLVAFASGAAPTGFTMAIAGLLIFAPVAGYMVLHKLRLPGRVGEFVAALQRGVRTPSMVLVLLLSTCASWSLVAVGWYACLVSISIHLGFFDSLALLAVVTLASIASLIPGGLGVAEASVATALLHFGVAAPLAQAGALCLRGYSLLVILLGVAHLLTLRARSSHLPGATASEAR